MSVVRPFSYRGLQQKYLSIGIFVAAIVFVILYVGAKKTLKMRSRVPIVKDFAVSSAGPVWDTSGKADLIWTASSDSIPFVKCCTAAGNDFSDETCAITNVLNEGESWSAEAIVKNNANYNFSLTVVLDSNTANATVNDYNVSCVLGHVLIKTTLGSVPISTITEGDLIEQMNGSFLAVKRVKTDFITSETKMPDGRLFAKDLVALTFWHKVLENGEWELPEDAGWREITNQMSLPLPIFHLELEKQGVLISGNIVIESLHD